MVSVLCGLILTAWMPLVREYSFNIQPVGLKAESHSVDGHNELRNLLPEKNYFRVPTGVTTPWNANCQVLRGSAMTLHINRNQTIQQEGYPDGAILINDITDFQAIGNDPAHPMDGYYVLTGDIDASNTETWNDGAGFDPIGSMENPFTGVIDGAGYEITDLVIDRPEETLVGLVALNQGIIGNLRVDGHVIGLGGTGILCGRSSGLIQKCSVGGYVYGAGGSGVGGMVGSHSGGTIQDSYAQVDVVSLSTEAGGLVGININIDSDVLVARCWSAGSVNAGSLNDDLNTGGLVGAQGSTGATTEASYYDSETSGQSDDIGKGTPKTTAELQNILTYDDWDFQDTWQIESGQYPSLIAPEMETEDVIRTIISSVNESTLALTQLKAVPDSTARWQMADFGPYWIITDGTTVVFRSGVTTYIAGVRLGAVCAQDARLIYGDTAAGQNVVGWSTISGADVPYILSGASLPAKLAALNQAAKAVMPWRGKVHAILQVGNNLVVYGADGITGLTPHGGGYGLATIENLPRNIGLRGRSEVAGNGEINVFVGSDGALYTIDASLKATRMGYKWLLGNAVTLNYREDESQFLLSGATSHYVLSQYGMGGPVSQGVTSVAMMGDTPIGTGTSLAASLPIFLHTNTFDMSQNGLKKVTVVNVNGQFTAGSIGLLYSYGNDNVWREKSPVPINRFGAAFINQALMYGQMKMLATAHQDSRITRIEMRYQPSDRRFVRGTRGVASADDNS